MFSSVTFTFSFAMFNFCARSGSGVDTEDGVPATEEIFFLGDVLRGVSGVVATLTGSSVTTFFRGEVLRGVEVALGTFGVVDPAAPSLSLLSPSMLTLAGDILFSTLAGAFLCSTSLTFERNFASGFTFKAGGLLSFTPDSSIFPFSSLSFDLALSLACCFVFSFSALALAFSSSFIAFSSCFFLAFSSFSFCFSSLVFLAAAPFFPASISSMDSLFSWNLAHSSVMLVMLASSPSVKLRLPDLSINADSSVDDSRTSTKSTESSSSTLA